MNDSSSDSSILAAAGLLHDACYAVVLTGAGISTPSGIPDFRSQRNGLWQHNDPMQVASLTAFHRRPEKFFEWLRPLAAAILRAEPNPAHIALAELEKAGRIKAVITQNIDDLHQKAGSTNVLELHGSMNSLSCPQCHRKYPSSEYKSDYIDSGEMPRCRDCHTFVKPDIVLYEEMLPTQTWDESMQHCLKTDLMIVAGSSLEVFPANSLPVTAVDHGAKLVILNIGPTTLDQLSEICIQEDVAIILPRLKELVL